jgi:hypothetical protein
MLFFPAVLSLFAVGTFEAGRVAFYTSFGDGVLSILRPSAKLALRG